MRVETIQASFKSSFSFQEFMKLNNTIINNCDDDNTKNKKEIQCTINEHDENTNYIRYSIEFTF